jgi:hypothetical protein
MDADADRIALLAPAVYISITIEQADEGDDIHLHAGGQALWVARVLRQLGHRPVACAPVGGEAGRTLLGLIGEWGVTVHPIQTLADTPAYVHDRRGGNGSSWPSGSAVIPWAASNRHHRIRSCRPETRPWPTTTARSCRPTAAYRRATPASPASSPAWPNSTPTTARSTSPTCWSLPSRSHAAGPTIADRCGPAAERRLPVAGRRPPPALPRRAAAGRR